MEEDKTPRQMWYSWIIQEREMCGKPLPNFKKKTRLLHHCDLFSCPSIEQQKVLLPLLEKGVPLDIPSCMLASRHDEALSMLPEEAQEWWWDMVETAEALHGSEGHLPNPIMWLRLH